MASYRGHLAVASALGAAYGGAAGWYGGADWGPVFLAAGLTTLGGMAPDLDSDSGVPVRELFGLAAVVVPLLLLRRLTTLGFSAEQLLVLLGGLYLAIRYGLMTLFKHWTVHRGMFHSIPALFIAGLLVFVLYHSPSLQLRFFLSGGMMLGFLSHLVLDELCSVNFSGVSFRLNKYAGSALKFVSPSRSATLTAYVLLAGLIYLASRDPGISNGGWQTFRSQIVKTWSHITAGRAERLSRATR